MIWKILYIYLFILFIFISTELFAGEKKEMAKEFYPYTEWVPVAASKDGNISAIRFDESLLAEEIKRIWVKYFYSIKGAKIFTKNNQLKGLDNLYMSISRIIFNCKDKTFSPLAEVFYDKQGNVLRSYDFSELPIKWELIIPDSMGDMLFKFVCMPREVILNTFSLLQRNGCNDVDSCQLLFQRALIEYLEESLRYYTPPLPDDPNLPKPPPPPPAPAPAPAPYRR